MNVVGEAERLLSEAEDDLPSLEDWINRDPFSRGKKRLQRERKALKKKWEREVSRDRARLRGARNVVDKIAGDMGPEWKDEGYTDAEVESTAFGTAHDMRPDLRWWLIWNQHREIPLKSIPLRW